MNLKLLRISAFCGLCAASLSAVGQEVEEPVVSTDPSMGGIDRLQWRMFKFRPRLSSSLIYDDNVNLSSTNELEDITWNLNPGVAITAGEAGGRTFSLDYSPVVRVFAERTENNALDHLFSVSALWPFSRLTLGANAGYDKLSTPVTYIGDRVDREAYNLGINAGYVLSPKTSLSISGDYSRTLLSDNLIGSTGFSNDNSVDYQLSPKLSLGLGATFGLTQPDRGGDQTSQALTLRSQYEVAAKLDVSASVGSSWTQYERADGSTVSPVFSLAATYTPLDSTTITLEGHRNNAVSPTAAGVNYYATGFGLTVRQRVWENIFGRVTGSYDHLEYLPNGSSNTLRTDNNYAIELGLDATLSQHWSAGVFVLHRESSSDSARGVAFENNQVGIQTSYSF